MKYVLITAMISSIAITAHAQAADGDRAGSAAGVGMRPIVHATERAAVFAEPNATSKVVLVVMPSDGLYAGATHGEWTQVQLATGVGWIPAAKLQPARADVSTGAGAGSQPQASLGQADTAETQGRPVGRRWVNGFRLGWMYIGNIDKMQAETGQTLRERVGLKSPHMFLLGYELVFRAISHSWMNAILVGNLSVAGIEQSKFIPSVNGLVGVEVKREFQAAVGISLTPDGVAPTHMILAAGWTPEIGSIQTPVHLLYIPDPNGNYRMGATIGMNW